MAVGPGGGYLLRFSLDGNFSLWFWARSLRFEYVRIEGPKPDLFPQFLGHFDHFYGFYGHFTVKIGHFWPFFGPFLGHFWPKFDQNCSAWVWPGPKMAKKKSRVWVIFWGTKCILLFFYGSKRIDWHTNHPILTTGARDIQNLGALRKMRVHFWKILGKFLATQKWPYILRGLPNFEYLEHQWSNLDD